MPNVWKYLTTPFISLGSKVEVPRTRHTWFTSVIFTHLSAWRFEGDISLGNTTVCSVTLKTQENVAASALTDDLAARDTDRIFTKLGIVVVRLFFYSGIPKYAIQISIPSRVSPQISRHFEYVKGQYQKRRVPWY